MAFTVVGGSAYQAVAIVKLVENDPRYGFLPRTSKIATCKVDPETSGSKLGELLLKAVLQDAATRDSAGLFVKVHPHHTRLVALLEDFGFVDTEQRTVSGEVGSICAPGGRPRGRRPAGRSAALGIATRNGRRVATYSSLG